MKKEMTTPKSAPQRRRRGGFTLLEICVAILVVGLGMSSLLAVFSAAFKQAQNFRTDIAAGMTALSVYDLLRVEGSIPSNIPQPFGILYVSLTPASVSSGLTFVNVKLSPTSPGSLADAGEFGFWIYRP